MITLKNCFILPGVPKLLRQTFEGLLKSNLLGDASQHKTTVRECYILSDEIAITDQLNTLVVKYQDSVVFGSYPQWEHNYYKTKITVESQQESIVEKVVQEICETMETVNCDNCPTVDAMQKMALLLKNSQVLIFVYTLYIKFFSLLHTGQIYELRPIIHSIRIT